MLSALRAVRAKRLHVDSCKLVLARWWSHAGDCTLVVARAWLHAGGALSSARAHVGGCTRLLASSLREYTHTRSAVRDVRRVRAVRAVRARWCLHVGACTLVLARWWLHAGACTLVVARAWLHAGGCTLVLARWWLHAHDCTRHRLGHTRTRAALSALSAVSAQSALSVHAGGCTLVIHAVRVVRAKWVRPLENNQAEVLSESDRLKTIRQNSWANHAA